MGMSSLPVAGPLGSVPGPALHARPPKGSLSFTRAISQLAGAPPRTQGSESEERATASKTEAPLGAPPHRGLR